jgi:uncharacterized membrane protein YhaH (DUF805 family)
LPIRALASLKRGGAQYYRGRFGCLRQGGAQPREGVMDFSFLFTSFDGRINRKPYWLGVLVMVVVSLVVMLMLAFLVGIQGRSFMILTFVVQLILLYPSAALMVKRLHDRNRPSWFAALILVPLILQGITNIIGITGDPTNQGMLDYLFAAWIFIVGVWFFIELGCLRGTIGDNQFGPDPLAGQVGDALAR